MSGDGSQTGQGSSGGACSSTCGISKERERHKATARALAGRAYPGYLWTPLPAWVPDEAPVPRDEITELAATLESLLPTRALLLGYDGGGNDGIYLLGGMHAPCWLEVRARGAGAVELAPARDEETYLRVIFSPIARYYTLQEVRVAAVREASGVWVEERRLVGVEDRRLQLFVKATQGLLRKHRLIGLDAAFLSETLPDPGGEISERLGAAPTLWTLLFDRTPAGSVRGEYLE